jgi:hypothetical protein
MTEPPLTTVEGVRANQRRSTRNSSLANNTDMDRLQAMLTFVTVVETEGFASAARKLAVSPSVISRVVTELEELLGVRLLTRTTRFMRLTEAGAAYFEDRSGRIVRSRRTHDAARPVDHHCPRSVRQNIYHASRARLSKALSGSECELLVSGPHRESGRRRRGRGDSHRRTSKLLSASSQGR